MVYNSNADGQDIVSLIGDITGIDTTVEIKQITRAVNAANRKIWTWIFNSYGGWQYDDSNNTDMPVAKAKLEANQQKYTLPTEALTIKALEYKNSGGDWVKLNSVPVERINQFLSENEWHDTPSEPAYYSVTGRVIKLYPASDTERADGLRIQFDRGSTSFASTDTTKTPGFSSEFHDSLATGAAYFIGINKTLPNWELIRTEWMDAEQRIKDFYQKKWDEEFPMEFHTSDTLTQYI